MRRALVLSCAAAALALAAGGASPKVVAKIRSPLSPCAATAAFGAVWVTSYGEARVFRIDRRTNKVTARIRIGHSPCGIAAGAGSLWLNGYGTGTVERGRPSRRMLVESIGCGRT